MQLLTQIAVNSLSAHELLSEVSYSMSETKIEKIIYSIVRKYHQVKDLPDYVYKNGLVQLFKSDYDGSHIITTSFDYIIDFLEYKSGYCYVKEESFQEWQHVILSVSPLMIFAYYAAFNRFNLDSFIEQFHYSLLPSIFNKKLDSIIDSI